MTRGKLMHDWDGIERMKGVTQCQRSCLRELVRANHRASMVRADSRFAARNTEVARMHAETLAMNDELRRSLAQTFAREQPTEAAWIPMDWFISEIGVTYSPAPIPATRVRSGDVLMHARSRGRATASGFHSIALSVTELQVLRDARESLVHAGGAFCRTLALDTLNDRRTWRRRRNGTYKPALFIVRPVRPETVWRSIDANSVDAAIFELLGSVGCRMPQRKDG